MFGRGLDSEIGTYVTKTFQSELSGNIIDLCPVGALTSKPYPFVSRNWELKSVSSLDFSDGFATNVQVFVKNNQIIKITPEYDPSTNSTNWISDKTRFAFDGMFSPENTVLSDIHRIIHPVVRVYEAYLVAIVVHLVVKVFDIHTVVAVRPSRVPRGRRV